MLRRLCFSFVPTAGLPNINDCVGNNSKTNFLAAAAWSTYATTVNPFSVTILVSLSRVTATELLLAFLTIPSATVICAATPNIKIIMNLVIIAPAKK